MQLQKPYYPHDNSIVQVLYSFFIDEASTQQVNVEGRVPTGLPIFTPCSWPAHNSTSHLSHLGVFWWTLWGWQLNTPSKTSPHTWYWLWNSFQLVPRVWRVLTLLSSVLVWNSPTLTLKVVLWFPGFKYQPNYVLSPDLSSKLQSLSICCFLSLNLYWAFQT